MSLDRRVDVILLFISFTSPGSRSSDRNVRSDFDAQQQEQQHQQQPEVASTATVPCTYIKTIAV